MRFLAVFFLGLLVLALPVNASAKKSVKKHKITHSKTVKRHVVLKPFTPVLFFSREDTGFLEVTKNTLAILAHIRALNPQVSSEDAYVMASSLSVCGLENQVDPKFVAAVISVESRFNRYARHNGALGLGQLMGRTAKTLGVEDPFSITQNVRGTTVYIKTQLDLFPNSDCQPQLALACYLMGPNAVTRHRKGNRNLFDLRVHRYVNRVLAHYEKLLWRLEVEAEQLVP